MEMTTTVGSAGHVAQAREGFFRLLRLSISSHSIYLALIALYYAAFLTIYRLRPEIAPSNFWDVALGFTIFLLPMMIFGLAIMRLYHVAVHIKPERPLPALIRDIGAYLSNPVRLAHGLPMVLIMVMFMYVFVELKASIPILNPYSWDQALDHADRVLHFGTHPWQWLQPILGYAPLTFVINVNYSIWFAVMWIVWVYFAFLETDSIIRTRFFLTFFTAWIVGGGLMAIWFSSMGPCFYGRIGLTPDPYAGLMDYLRQANEVVPIWAVAVQDLLWQGYNGDQLIEGISAMPSMHNGTALLFVLAAYPVNRLMGWILAIHGALIFIGSIVLAWHYAIDGYAAAALVLVLWWLMGPVSRWWHGRAAHTEFAEAIVTCK